MELLQVADNVAREKNIDREIVVTAMEEAIINAKDMAAIAALFVSSDEDQNKRGLLFDWPEFS